MRYVGEWFIFYALDGWDESESRLAHTAVRKEGRVSLETLALNMRTALPNAAFMAFTGTPLIEGEEKTRQVFGDYVSVYNFQQSTTTVFEHVYDAYYGAGQSIYAA